ncbi:MAG: methionine aminotransferase [Burkholderiaceae bacterium]|nr:methionine aminotransferase [Burkholderiaceae bacterium]
MNIQSKLPDVGTTIFTVMSQLCVDHKAINLGQGFPDFHPASTLVDYVTQAMKDGYNQYPPMTGIPALRMAIANKVEQLYGKIYDQNSEITVTSGASEALMASILAFVHTGDEVIIIEPFYDLYIPAIKLAGGIPVIVSMQAPTESNPRYQIDWDRVSAAVTDKTRMLILNFPHNPTGINLDESDLDQLEALVNKTNIILLSDEVYEHIVFDGKQHQSLARRESLAANAIVVSSFGKTYHTTGWKVGYCCAPAALSTEIRKVHQFMVFTVPSPLQVALANYMADPAPYLNLSEFYKPKRDRLFQGLKNTRFVPLHSEGTFFLLASYEKISDLPESEFAHWLTTTHGVGGIPVSAFYDDAAEASSNHALIRFCFAKQDHTLDAALEKLAAI